MSYYNTIEEVGTALTESKKKTRKQEDLIYSLFQKRNEPLSPSMVLSESGLNCPITSIRRAMTDLTNSGHIVKTDRQVRGMYNKPEHLWELPDMKEPKQVSLFD
jgi:predicted transcriptional regulator